LNSGKGVPVRITVLGILLGLLLGGALVGISFGQLTAGKGGSATTTETATATSVFVSVVTSIVGAGAAASTVTTTITQPLTGAPKGPSMNLEATELLYYYGDTVSLVGTVYPPPSGSTGIAVTTKNPLGTAVQVGQAETGITNGTFFYLLSTATSTNWVSGQYLVNATVAGQSATATFYYSAAPNAHASLLSLQILAPSVAAAGQPVSLAVVTTFPNGVLDEVTSWSTFAVLFPDGTFHNLCTSGATSSGCTGTFARIHTGFYQVTFTLPATAPRGAYYVEAAGSDSTGNSTRGAGQFSVP
jgi:hypothetical protein